MLAEDGLTPSPKQHYTFAGLLAQCDPNEPALDDLECWRMSMSTKSSLVHGPGFHLYQEVFDDDNVYLEVDSR